MYKRLVAMCLDAGLVSVAAVARFTDEGLLIHLDTPALPPGARAQLNGLRRRRLHKRAYECPAALLGEGLGEWIASDYTLTRRVEDALAIEMGLPIGTLLLDYPVKTQMLGLELPMLRRSGHVELLTAAGWEGEMNLPRLSDEFYRSARRLRVFTAERQAVPEGPLLKLLRQDVSWVRSALNRGEALLR